MKKGLLIVCLLFAIAGLHAQVLTLDECQRLAAENYPAVSKYELIEQTTELSVQKLNMGYVPQLKFLAQVTYQSDVPTLPEFLTGMPEYDAYIQSKIGTGKGSISQAQYDRGDYGFADPLQYRLALQLDQVIWDGGTIEAQKRVARAQGEVQKAAADVDMYALRDRVNNLFFGVLLLNEKIELLSDVEALLEANARKLDTLYAGGLVTTADKATLQAELYSVQQQRMQLEYSSRTCKKLLGMFVGRDVDEYDGLQKPDILDVLPTENRRPELLQMEAQLRLFDAQEKLVKTSVIPNFSLFATGFFSNFGYDIFKNMFARGLRPDAQVGVALKWNISNFYTLNKTKKQIQIGRQMVSTGRETFLFNMNQLTTQNSENIALYRAMMEKDEQIIALRTEIRQAAEIKLENGIIDLNNLLAEIQKEDKAKNDHVSHEIEMLKQMYELKNRSNN